MRTHTTIYYVLTYHDGQVEECSQTFGWELTRRGAIYHARENLEEIRLSLAGIEWGQVTVEHKPAIDYTVYGWWDTL